MAYNKIRSGIVRLRVALPVFFALFLLLTGSIIFTVNYFLSLKNLEDVASDYLQKTGTTVLDKTINHLAPAFKMSRLNAEQLVPDNFEKDFSESFNAITIPQFITNPQFALVYYGSESGDFYMNGLDPDGSISTQIIRRLDDTDNSDGLLRDLKERQDKAKGENSYNEEFRLNLEKELSTYLKTTIDYRDPEGNIIKKEDVMDYIYDPRWRPWYINSKRNGETSWTGAYQFSSSGRYYASGKTGVTVSSPVYDNRGDFIGTIGIDIFLEELTNFLKTLEISENGRAFIVNSELELIAFSSLNLTGGEDPDIFTNISQIDDPVLQASAQTISNNSLTSDRTLSISHDNSNYISYLAPLPPNAGPKWIIGIVAPEDDFIGELKSQLQISMFIAIGVIILMVLLSIYIGNKITLPIKNLMKDAMLVKDLDLRENPVIPSIFKEIEDMNDAFQVMKVGLRSFKKYIPSDVVKYLINTGNEAVLGGNLKNLTIFFSDVADFTSISENLAPGKLVGHLGDYLGEYSRIIQSTQGTVDKYIGDAIMAFWNAPGDVEDHYNKSCEAALQCIEKLNKLHHDWDSYNLPRLHTRIGIHTGDVIVGNMGSPERLNYTIIGDSVNLASRLEGLAKIYGVNIMVSETTKSLASKNFQFRKLDKVLVKGKSIPVTVYELVSRKGDLSAVDRKWIETYHKALDLYFNQNWEESKKLFVQCYRTRDKDKSAALFINRINHYIKRSPGEDWDGVYVFRIKK